MLEEKGFTFLQPRRAEKPASRGVVVLFDGAVRVSLSGFEGFGSEDGKFVIAASCLCYFNGASVLCFARGLPLCCVPPFQLARFE